MCHRSLEIATCYGTKHMGILIQLTTSTALLSRSRRPCSRRSSSFVPNDSRSSPMNLARLRLLLLVSESGITQLLFFFFLFFLRGTALSSGRATVLNLSGFQVLSTSSSLISAWITTRVIPACFSTFPARADGDATMVVCSDQRLPCRIIRGYILFG
jgi:hypothetical protein